MKQLIAAMESTGCVPVAAVMIDGPMEPYLEVPWPAHWHIHQSNVHLELSGALNALFKLHPDEKTYGFMCDHGRPESPEWATELERSAGDWNIAFCNDYHNRINPRTNQRRLTEATCFGGELVRAIGWVWPDFMVHLYGDDVWEDIGYRLGNLIWRNDVYVRSLQFAAGEIPIDDNHKRMFRGEPFAAKDAAAYFDTWLHERDDLYDKLETLLPAQPITVVCVKWGEKYGPEYVNILFDMVNRNLPARSGRFVCYTDDPQGIDEEIEIQELPEGLEGWWNKLYLFKEGVFKEGERVIFLDLDTILCGHLNHIFNYKGEFAILRDFYRPNGYGSGMMMWRGGFGSHIWDSYEKAGYPDINGGDQAWIERQVSKADLLQELYPQSICSYKEHALDGIPKGIKIICFHGYPKPHECDGWVPNVWKIGGGTPAEYEMVCNVDEGMLVRHIRHSLTLPHPWLRSEVAHDGHAVIVGGGPSLKGQIEEIRLREQNDQRIFATNATYNWLFGQGIKSSAHVMLDARRENTEFTPMDNPICYYASQCHPDLFDEVKKKSVVLWHPLIDGIQGIIGNNTGDNLVGGGCSVGLKAICLAFILGYRNFHLYGFDSCYEDDQHHAYVQPLNDGAKIVDVMVGDRKFKCAAWMMTQAEQFKEMLPALLKEGCTITVHGDGLIPYLASQLGQPYEYVANTPDAAYNHTNNLLNRSADA